MWGVNLCNYELTKSIKSHLLVTITLLILHTPGEEYFTLSIVTHSVVMVATILIFSIASIKNASKMEAFFNAVVIMF